MSPGVPSQGRSEYGGDARRQGKSDSRDFRLFWLGGAVNLLGSQATGLVLPILVLSVGGSPLTAGAVGTVSALLEVVIAPIAGVYADRGPRRALMVGALAVAAAATGTIALAVGLHHAWLPLLFGCAAVGGAATGVYTAVASAAVRGLLSGRDPQAALGQLQAREQAARLAGPGAGGALYQLAAWVPFLVDAVSYLIAAACVRAIRADLRPAPAPEATGQGAAVGFRGEFTAGLRFVWAQPFLRFVTMWAGGLNLLVGTFSFEVVLLARAHRASAGSIGLVLTIAGGAGVAGALLAAVLLSRLRAGPLVLVASWAIVAAAAPFTLSQSVWIGGLLLAVVSLLAPTLGIIFQSKAIMLTPDHLQGRAGTVLATLGEGTGALAPALAGALVAVARPWLVALLPVVGLTLLACYASVNVAQLRTSAPSPPPEEAVPKIDGGDRAPA